MILPHAQDKKTDHDRKRGNADEHVQPLRRHESFQPAEWIKRVHDCKAHKRLRG